MFDCEIYRSSAQIAKHDWLQLENSFMVIKESINYMRVEVFVCQLWRATGQLTWQRGGRCDRVFPHKCECSIFVFVRYCEVDRF